MRVFEQGFHFSKVNGPTYTAVTLIYSTACVKQDRVYSETVPRSLECVYNRVLWVTETLD